MPAEKLNLDAFMAQAMEYENWEAKSDRVQRFFLEIGATHSYAVRRVSEVMRWVQSGEYDRIARGEYRRRGDERPAREEAGDAVDFYRERFRAFFRELSDNVTSIGSQVDGRQPAARGLGPQPLRLARLTRDALRREAMRRRRLVAARAAFIDASENRWNGVRHIGGFGSEGPRYVLTSDR